MSAHWYLFARKPGLLQAKRASDGSRVFRPGHLGLGRPREQGHVETGPVKSHTAGAWARRALRNLGFCCSPRIVAQGHPENEIDTLVSYRNDAARRSRVGARATWITALNSEQHFLNGVPARGLLATYARKGRSMMHYSVYPRMSQETLRFDNLLSYRPRACLTRQCVLLSSVAALDRSRQTMCRGILDLWRACNASPKRGRCDTISSN